MTSAQPPELAELRQAKTSADRQNLLNALRSRDALRGVQLMHCALSGVDFAEADLSGANFQHADLSGAVLTGAKLVHAGLRWANLSAASLENADCSGSFLWEVELTGAILTGADFSGASVIGTHFETSEWQTGHITLPDGTIWMPDVDLRRFSDPRHPEYEAALAATNLLRLGWGVALLGKHDAAHRLYYPLPGERLSRDEMRARIQA